MVGCFLDTTLVVDLSDVSAAGGPTARAHVDANPPATAPYYALRELLAGHVQILCDAHNVLLSADNLPEAAMALLNRPPVEGRKREAKLRALVGALSAAFAINPAGPRNHLKREMLQDLAIRANSTWRRAHHINSVTLIQALGCFNDGTITYGPVKELRGPQGSFNCIKAERCAAAAYIYEDKGNLKRLIEALHPNSLGKMAEKNENQKRRKALKELMSIGPTKFDKDRCRALGDAYFAAMCPAGSKVVTTNIQDHDILCRALGRTAVKP